MNIKQSKSEINPQAEASERIGGYAAYTFSGLCAVYRSLLHNRI